MATTLKSIAFPFQLGTTSFPRMVEDDEAIRGQLEALVLTSKGERVMRPELGLNAYEMIFETVTPIMKARLAADVARQLRDCVPKAMLQRVDVYEVTEQDQSKSVYVDIQYVVAGKPIAQQISVMNSVQ